ncbi:MAG: 3-hydroxyacyl-CoA dehydrogenase NAD-binding domain-containing protein [Candidatus Obscuribacterales bacterium]|jgi:3-hydroxybutyryl-CoA dehydrogenase|nr:3-hydroxyacyl-CoA dehydrogenase NAD-binding domain-containing protein [Candidatus Obscuribacterales bacterium]
MNSTDIKTVFMAGSGFMGSAIAFLIATKTNCTVYLYDIAPDSLKKAEAGIAKMGKSSVEKGFISQEKLDDAVKRVKTVSDLKEAASADLVIEAIAEVLTVKQELFSKLDSICKPETIFASNTSSLPITSIAAATKRAKQVIGMHFFSPAHIMKLLELIPGIDTAPDVVQAVTAFGEQLGKTVITCKDMPGFITTRLGMVLMNEAAFALMEGLSTPEEIDKGISLGYNHPMGPLALADFVGLDICLHAMETIHKGFGDPKYRPCPLIRQLVSAGHLGRKTGKGFFEYGGAN